MPAPLIAIIAAVLLLGKPSASPQPAGLKALQPAPAATRKR